MKYTMKITASLMAAVMSLSAVGAASAGAVEFSVVGGGGSNQTTSETPLIPTTPSSNSQKTTSSIQNATPEFFNGCVKLSWAAVPGAASYAVKICTTDGTVIRTYYQSYMYTAVTVPETVFNVEYKSNKDFYACVIALKTGDTDTTGSTFYAPSASKFTVKSDMSEYPEYGAPQSVAFMVKDGKLLIGWKNPNDFMKSKDIFDVSIVDRSGKTVFSKSITDCSVEAKGLKDGEKYTVKIVNRSFSAMTATDYTFVSDLTKKQAGESSSVAAEKKGAVTKLSAPNSVSTKAGNSKITLSWSSIEGADAYRIYVYDAASKKYKALKTVKGTKYTIKNLTNGKTYKFKVAAVRYNASTKKYEPGKLSGAVKATPKAPAASTKKTKG